MAREVLVLPGIGSDKLFLPWELKCWERFGLKPQIHYTDWGKQKDFRIIRNEIAEKIDELSQNEPISIMAQSAAGPAALDAFIVKKDRIKRLVTVCAPLRSDGQTMLMSFISRRYPALEQSLKEVEQVAGSLSNKDLSRIMTVQPIWDEQVPVNLTTLSGAVNLKIPFIGHNPSITFALLVPKFRNQILKFLKG